MKWFRKKANHALFDQWISAYHNALYKHALWMTGNKDLAFDMVQDTYFQAWTAMEKLQDKDKAFPWLLTILRRAIYREQRYQYRQTETMAALEILDDDTTPDYHYQLLEIYRALESLSTAHREALLLHYLHGFSYEEISAQLEIPVGTVMSRISRARESIRRTHTSETDNVINLQDIRRGQKHE